MRYRYITSPIGELLLAGHDVLELLGFPDGHKARRAEPGWQRDRSCFAEVAQQVDEYFAGERQTFDVPYQLSGTPFQQSVWQALTSIPYGATCSYKDIATLIGNPRAVRAVGAANGNNPVPIIVPCHRVVGSSGQLTGFGGGLRAKAFLLDLEQGRRPLFL